MTVFARVVRRLNSPISNLAVILVLSAPQVGSGETQKRQMAEVLAQARTGDATAQAEAGVRYLLGDAVRRNYERALEWLTMAASQGFSDANCWLAWMYSQGWGVSKDEFEATRLYRSAAEGGSVSAQYSLGFRYAQGIGIAANSAEAIKWYTRASEQGNADAMMALGNMYRDGDGIPVDLTLAHVWFNLAALYASDDHKAEIYATERDGLLGKISPQQLAKAQAMTTDWMRKHPRRPPPDVQLTAVGDSKLIERGQDVQASNEVRSGMPLELAATGSGFLVNRAGLAVTNAHVVHGCTAIFVEAGSKRWPVNILAEDNERDLAILGALRTQDLPLALRRSPIREGESILTLGYPLRGILSSSPNVTTGIVSASAGILNNPDEFQITAPVQPGNSGGPVVDENGNVLGVVSSKLDALKVAENIGDIPQNVNFAIKESVLARFLDANGVSYRLSLPGVGLKTTEIVNRVRSAVYVVECWQ